MTVKVVDASALVALLLAESQAAAVASQLSGASLVAPHLLAFEVANTCLKKMRRDPGQEGILLSAFAAFMRMPIKTVEVDHEAALRLAQESGLTAYDASYLWLARKLDAELVTLDKQLTVAATR